MCLTWEGMIYQYSFLHYLFPLACFMWKKHNKCGFLKILYILFLDWLAWIIALRQKSSGHVCCTCDWWLTTGIQSDRETGTREPALPQDKYPRKMWLITATWQLILSFRGAVNPNQLKPWNDRQGVLPIIICWWYNSESTSPKMSFTHSKLDKHRDKKIYNSLDLLLYYVLQSNASVMQYSMIIITVSSSHTTEK